jgi:hypothetical protein
MDRRTFCLTGVAVLSGAAPAIASERAVPAPGISFYKFVYDRRYPAGRAFGAAAENARSTAGTVAIDGDVTALWSRDLRLQWAAGGGAIAGMATLRSLFCLEQLAKDHWRRTVIRVEHHMPDNDRIVHRMTAPEPMMDRMQSTLLAVDWPAKLPAALTTCRPAGDAPRTTRVLGPACEDRAAMLHEPLVSFVII